ncbi:O-antigen ligase family protein [Vibrio sp. TRT 21S02]|uniref:O-antigen ligase family protein n=1 Tax=Vibrio sp. TRT 21S02 TaxID=3418507 RepID=UPI003CF52C32
MLNTTNKNKLVSLLFSIPILWMATGMLWDGDGDMRLVPIVLLVALTSLFLFKFDTIKDNFNSNFWIKILLVSSCFGIFAYLYYGFDSRELRATITILLVLLVIPSYYYRRGSVQWFLLVCSVCCSIYGYYFQYLNSSTRSEWPINAIPFATISGLILIISINLLLISKCRIKKILILMPSIIFSLNGVLFSQSRGPLISVVIVLFISIFTFFLLKNKRSAFFSILAFSILSLSLIQIPLVNQRLNYTYNELNTIKNGNFDTSIGVRFQMQNIAFELWKQKPIFGYGKNIKREFARLEKKKIITPKVYRLISMTFHNGYLDKFVLYGIPGGLIFLTFLFYPIYLSRQYSLKEGSALLWAPALFMILCNLTDAPFINAQAAIYYMFIIGAMSMMLKNEKEQRLENV